MWRTVALAVLLAVWMTPVAEAAFPGTDGRIAGRCDPPLVGAPSEPCTIRKDGTMPVPLGRPGFYPERWSPDSKLVAGLETTSPSSGGRIGVLAADGSSFRQLGTRAASSKSIAWSPTGNRIAYLPQNLDGTPLGSVRVIDVSTGSDSAVATGLDGVYNAMVWSPLDETLAVVGEKGCPGANCQVGVWLVGLDGRAPRLLVRKQDAPDRGFGTHGWAPVDFSPRGDRILVLDNGGNFASTSGNVGILDVGTGAVTLLPSLAQTATHYPFDVAWSPDAQQLLVIQVSSAQTPGPNAVGRVGIANIDGSNFRQIAVTSSFFGTAWGSYEGGATAACPDTAISGTDGDDRLNGTAGNDVICGLGGNDVINGNGGHDVITGGDGSDTLSGGPGNDAISGGSGNDTAGGGADHDAISADAGNDTAAGDAGIDRVDGAAGNDTLSGGADGDVVRGGDGTDRVSGDTGDDVVRGGAGNDALSGGAGDDEVIYLSAPASMRVDLAKGTATGEGSDKLSRLEEVRGSLFADRITGSGADDYLDGSGGNDTVDGAGGDDFVAGGGGNDRLGGAAGDDLVSGGIGKNTIDGGAGFDECYGAKAPKGCELRSASAAGSRARSQFSDRVLKAIAPAGRRLARSYNATHDHSRISYTGFSGCKRRGALAYRCVVVFRQYLDPGDVDPELVESNPNRSWWRTCFTDLDVRARSARSRWLLARPPRNELRCGNDVEPIPPSLHTWPQGTKG